MSYEPRRPYLDDEPEGMLESDRDYLGNNNALAVRLLDAYGSEKGLTRFLAGMIRKRPTLAAQIFNDPDNPKWENHIL